MKTIYQQIKEAEEELHEESVFEAFNLDGDSVGNVASEEDAKRHAKTVGGLYAEKFAREYDIHVYQSETNPNIKRISAEKFFESWKP